MLKRKLQYFGQLLQRAESLEKTLIVGKIEGKKRRGGTTAGFLLLSPWPSRLTRISSLPLLSCPLTWAFFWRS